MQRAEIEGRRALLLCVFIGCAILVLAAVLLSRVIEVAGGAESDVVHTLEVQKSLGALLNDLRSAESGQRGFLITGEPRFLDAYHSVRAALDGRLALLRDLVRDNPQQVRRLDQLRPVIAERFAVIEQTLVLAERGDVEGYKGVLSRQGQPLMTELRRRIEEMYAVEGDLLIERRARARAGERRFTIAVLAILIGSGLLALTALFSIWRYTRSVTRAHNRLTLSHAELEARIGERTRELEEALQLANHERTRAEALLVDLNHRVGNNLALVSSFLMMQQRTIRHPEAARALSAAMARVQAVASTQRKLRLGPDLATVDAREVLGAVIDDIAAGLPRDDAIRIEHRIEPLEIQSRDAVSLGVLTSELVMNAVKHAFVARAEGTVTVVFARAPDGAPYLEVSDDGVGSIEEQTQPGDGLGAKIIDMVARQFGGAVARAPHSPGAARPGTRIRIDLVDLELDAELAASG